MRRRSSLKSTRDTGMRAENRANLKELKYMKCKSRTIMESSM